MGNFTKTKTLLVSLQLINYTITITKSGHYCQTKTTLIWMLPFCGKKTTLSPVSLSHLKFKIYIFKHQVNLHSHLSLIPRLPRPMAKNSGNLGQHSWCNDNIISSLSLSQIKLFESCVVGESRSPHDGRWLVSRMLHTAPYINCF